jgi:predicted amidohydrolase
LKDLPGRDFLIVLPECFNFAGDYKNMKLEPKIPANDALRQLADLSREYRIVFVTGLLHAIDRFNSAYLVDADLGPHEWRLLCHKRDRDCTEHYTCYPDEPTNCGNLLTGRALTLGL